MDPAKIQELEDRLGYSFKNRNESYRALTHSTFSKEEKERKIGARDCPYQSTYATLGDAILKAGLVSILIEKGVKTKGNVTISKADLENNLRLAKVGKRLHLLEDNYILHRVGKEEKLKEESVALCSDTVEALIGAIFIYSNSSMSVIKDCISKIFATKLEEMERKYLNEGHMGDLPGRP
ncbi:MAG: ribonuclease III domain-containing protein [Methanoregula sp.]|jgi:ribonuclease-3|uniref:ribonuclease III domain-containing protein n=1 Tax=Methanoregula sp. TaxID=2052170 RepID=UPI003C1DF146